ncbi:MAG: DUF2141 domain-containing protein [Bacteroidota bacterium]
MNKAALFGVLGLTLGSFSFAPHYSAQHTGTLVVTVTDIDPDYEGQLLVTLYNKEEGFPTEYKTGLEIKTIPVGSKKKITVSFENIPYGTYAVAVLHDEDGDAEMDYNWVGIPTEGWVCSNEVFPALRSPYFSESSFTFNTSRKTLTLEIDY